MSNDIITEATTTMIALLCNSFQVGQVTLCRISLMVTLKYSLNFDTSLYIDLCTGGRIRTHDQWFWRPLLYQLSYARLKRGANSPSNYFYSYSC
jgi:hypothetical protein